MVYDCFTNIQSNFLVKSPILAVQMKKRSNPRHPRPAASGVGAAGAAGAADAAAAGDLSRFSTGQPINEAVLDTRPGND